MDTPMSHSEFEELAAGYVLGALEPDDEHDFRRHLDGCAICEASVRELEAVVGELAYAVPPVDPPDTLWAGIRREIEPEAARRGVGATPGAAPRRRVSRRLLPGLAAAAAILIVVALSVWNLSLRDENAAIRNRLTALEQATQLANDPSAKLVTMDEVPGPEGAQATVIASSRQDRGVLLVQSLPPLARDRVYERYQRDAALQGPTRQARLAWADPAWDGVRDHGRARPRRQREADEPAATGRRATFRVVRVAWC